MKLSQNVIDFLNLNPFDQVRYSFHCLKAWTSAPRNYLVIKLVRFLSFIKLEKTSFYFLVYSGLLRRMIDRGLLTKEDLDDYLIKYDYPLTMLGYGERFSSPWRHTLTRLARLFRVR